MGDEAEIDATKVGGQVGLEGELAGENAANEIGYVACCSQRKRSEGNEERHTKEPIGKERER